MSNVTKVIKTLSLDLTNIPDNLRNDAKEEVGAYIVNEILRETAKGKSPVDGEGRFKVLTDPYAKKEKGGNKRANLRLEGDLMQALDHKLGRGDNITVGIEGTQAPKADGHNQLSSEARDWAAKTGRTEYKRRFIPSKKQDFTNKIMDGVDDILKDFREDPKRDEDLFDFDLATKPTGTSIENVDRIAIDFETIFTDDSIEAFLLDAIRRRGGGGAI